ncbi:MAG: CPBP family glutamic-type intramembrane protease [Psychroflexus sp.]
MRIIEKFKTNKFNSYLLLGLLLKAQFYILIIFVNYPGFENKFSKDTENIPDALAFSSNIYFILFMILLVPAIEEFMYRWPIFKDEKSISKKIVFAIIIILLLSFVFSPFQSLYNFLLVSILAISTCLMFLNSKRVSKNKRIQLQIILSALAFSLSHAGPKTLFYEPSLLSLSLFANFIGAGFLYAYLRYNFGIIWPILLHFTTNLFLISLYGIDSEIDATPVTFNTPTYQLEVKESGYFDDRALFHFSKDSLGWETLNLSKGLKMAIDFQGEDLRFFATDKHKNLDSLLDSFIQKKAFRVYKFKLIKKDTIDIQLHDVLKSLEQKNLMLPDI